MAKLFIIWLQAFVVHYTLKNRKPTYSKMEKQFYQNAVEWKKTCFPTIGFQVGKPARAGMLNENQSTI